MLFPFAPSPTPTPIIINMPSSVSPWWAVPLITAIAVLIGALVAFLSTTASDRRKLKADDRRQWDKEIRDLYVEASAICERIADINAFWFRNDSLEMELEDYERVVEYERKLRNIHNSFDLIAAPETSDASKQLANAVSDYAMSLHDRINDRSTYQEVIRLHEVLRDAVKQNLRIRRRNS